MTTIGTHSPFRARVPAIGRGSERTLAWVASLGPIVIVTLVAAALRLWAFEHVGGNPFYDAAVTSMGQSWHNLFFGAIEPGGRLAIDKTPADLWLQVASARVFGATGVAVRLPEVAAGIAAVPLLYDLVRRLSGRAAGLGAATALTVLPTAILTAHSDTMDSVMMLLDVLAAWLVVLGAQRGRGWPVVAAGAVIGVAFNVKLFEALLVVPALAVLALLTIDASLRRRITIAAGSLAAMVGVGLSWIVVASATPLSHRPWPFGSTDGSIWSGVFGYNGASRLTATASTAALRLDPPGAGRLFSSGGHDYLAIVGTMLLAALALGVVAIIAALARRSAQRPANRRQVGRSHANRPSAAQARVGTSRRSAAGAAFFATWLATGVVLLSHMERMQPRYLEAVSPAIAAALGITVASLARATARSPRLALAGTALVLGAAGTLASHAPAWAIAAALAGGVGAVLVAATAAPDRRMILAGLALVAALAAPTSVAFAVARAHASDAGLPSRISPPDVGRISAFLARHQGATPSGAAANQLASVTVMRAAPMIVHDGRPVLILTNVGGQPLLRADRLAALVATGGVRYALLGPAPCSSAPAGHCAPVVRWAIRHGRDLSRELGVAPHSIYRLTPAAPRGASARSTRQGSGPRA